MKTVERIFPAAVIGCADNLAHIAMRYMLSVCVERDEQGRERYLKETL